MLFSPIALDVKKSLPTSVNASLISRGFYFCESAKFRENKTLAKVYEFTIYESMYHYIIIGPRRDKTCLRGFRQSETQTSLLS